MVLNTKTSSLTSDKGKWKTGLLDWQYWLQSLKQGNARFSKYMPMKENRLMAKFDITLCYNEVE